MFLSLYKVDAVHKKEKKEKKNVLTPPSGKKTVQEIKEGKKQLKVKVAIGFSFHTSWIYILTHQIESTMSNTRAFLFP